MSCIVKDSVQQPNSNFSLNCVGRVTEMLLPKLLLVELEKYPDGVSVSGSGREGDVGEEGVSVSGSGRAGDVGEEGVPRPDLIFSITVITNHSKYIQSILVLSYELVDMMVHLR